MPNLGKHVAGLLLFSIILGSWIFIYPYLTLPDVIVPTAPVRPLLAGPVEGSHVSYKVRQVSIDFNHSTKHTVLSLKLLPGQPAPERLWVITHYFAPGMNRYGDRSSMTEFRQPFANANEIELTTADSWNSGEPVGGAKVGYFAHVYVWTGDTENSYPPDLPVDRDITNAEPVVVHWSDENYELR